MSHARNKTEVPDKKKTPLTAKKPVPVLEEVRRIAKAAQPHGIVRGKTYLYFCVQPSQEQVVFQTILKKRLMQIIAVYNYKDQIIGYVVQFGAKPVLDISSTGEGVAIFFSKEDGKHQNVKPKVIFTDQKLRVLSFDNQDFFVSVKWKSSQTGMEV